MKLENVSNKLYKYKQTRFGFDVRLYLTFLIMAIIGKCIYYNEICP